MAVPPLRALAGEHQVVGVLTNPDRPKGRGGGLQPSAVKEEALVLGIPVLQPPTLRDAAFLTDVRGLEPELLVCFAYGKIFPQAFLDLFPLGGINLHPSKLPDLRGPSPLNSLILRGDREGALTVQRLALEMDSGDILLQESFPIAEDETALGLSQRVAQRGGGIFLKALKGLAEGSLTPRPQDPSQATYCSLIRKEDGVLDWSLPALRLSRIIRAYNPWPGGRSYWKGVPLTLWEAEPYKGEYSLGRPGEVLGVDKGVGILVQTGEGILAVRRLQLQAKKSLDFQSFLNGSRDFCHSTLGVECDS